MWALFGLWSPDLCPLLLPLFRRSLPGIIALFPGLVILLRILRIPFLWCPPYSHQLHRLQGHLPARVRPGVRSRVRFLRCLLAFSYLLVGYLVVDLVGRTGFVELGKPGVGLEQFSPEGCLHQTPVSSSTSGLGSTLYHCPSFRKVVCSGWILFIAFLLPSSWEELHRGGHALALFPFRVGGSCVLPGGERRLSGDSTVMAELGHGTIEVEEEEEFMSFEQLVPLTAGVVPYVIAWPTDLHPGTSFETMFLVVIKRAGGLIGAIPLGVISDKEIQRGMSEASPHAMLGASTTIMVPGVHQDPSGSWELSGIEVALLVADFTSQVSDLLRLMVPEEPVFAFVSGQPAILPRPEELVSQVLEWLAAQGLARPEGPYQMDEEVE